MRKCILQNEKKSHEKAIAHIFFSWNIAKYRSLRALNDFFAEFECFSDKTTSFAVVIRARMSSKNFTIIPNCNKATHGKFMIIQTQTN